MQKEVKTDTASGIMDDLRYEQRIYTLNGCCSYKRLYR